MGSLDSNGNKYNHDLQLESRENVPAKRQNDGYLGVYPSVFMFVLSLDLEAVLRPGKPTVYKKKINNKHTWMHAPPQTLGQMHNIPGSSKPYVGQIKFSYYFQGGQL